MCKDLIDTIVIQQLINGDEESFSIVYRQYAEKVYRLAYRFLKDARQSEEIVQETFINLWLSRLKLNIEGDLWLYVFVIAKRNSINALRKVIRSEELLARFYLNIAAAGNTSEEEVYAYDLEKFTNTVIDNLPRQQQLVFKLSRTDGLSHQQIAEQLQISPNTVKNHLVGALKTLRIQLKYAGIL